MGNYKLSIIVTVYNKEQFVRRCLDSISRQMNKETEVIVIDDGSTDKSKEIVDEYKTKGFKVYHQKNKGVGGARNVGLKKASGEFITFMDADDSYIDGAIETLLAYTKKDLPIIQFGQKRWLNETELQRIDKAYNRVFELNALPRRWQMVWNKLYKAELIKDLKFREDMQFGEDELFNIEALIITKQLKHAPHTLVNHYFDDNKSLCRGGLSLERLEKLIEVLTELANSQTNKDIANWIFDKIKAHKNSILFKRYGYGRNNFGKYDIVYCVKESFNNDELKYSLRSVEENCKYRMVVFYGGCPNDLTPDRHVHILQSEPTKWERVHNMLLQICDDDDITEDFWLFNDDFFILKKMPETLAPQYNGTIYEHIVHIEGRHGSRPTIYTQRLRHLAKTLEENSLGCLNYAVHKPMLFNRKKLKEVLTKFPDEPMTRTLYGNYCELGGEDKRDMKVQLINYKHLHIVKTDWEFVSTDDKSFRFGTVGEFIRERFNQKSRFEK